MRLPEHNLKHDWRRNRGLL